VGSAGDHPERKRRKPDADHAGQANEFDVVY
jgi:hypothetical protein